MDVKKVILGVIGNKLLSSAVIAHAEDVGPSFKKIELESDSFKGRVWRPGEKIQINVGEWNVRTYTPLTLDSLKGNLKIVAYLHGNGPGSEWAKNAMAGQSCQFIGPSSSIQLEPQPETILIFGDETSLAMAATFQKERGPTLNTDCLFEVLSPESCKPVVESLGLFKASVIKKIGLEVPSELLKRFEEKISNQKFDRIILTGSAHSIQRVRSELKRLNFPLSQVKVKAYWSLGKTGID